MLSSPQTPEVIFETALQHFGPIDILINNAAHSSEASVHELTIQNIDAHFAVNVRGMMLLCAEFVRQWQHHPTKRGGRIINLTSGQGLDPMPGELPYAASKGAVDAFTISLSHELMPLGITVNAVDPGLTDSGWLDADQRALWEQTAPRGRVGLPEDAAQIILFLASAQSDWITGQIIRSRGGL